MQQKRLITHEKTPTNERSGEGQLTESISPISFDQIDTYFKFISGGEGHEVFTGGFLDSHGKEVIKGFGIVHGTAKELIAMCGEIWRETQGSFHVCMNRTNLKGRRLGDIQSTRVLVVDLDVVTDKAAIVRMIQEYSVDMAIESSPGKFHLYWKLEGGAVGLEEWGLFQLGLAVRFGGDQEFRVPTKTIRIPGIPRVTKEGTWFTPQIVYYAPDRVPLSREDVWIRFPWVTEEAEKGEAERKKRLKRIRKAVKTRDFTAIGTLGAVGRNETLYEAVRTYVVENGDGETAYEYAYTVAEELKGLAGGHPFDDREIEKTIDSAIMHGMERREEVEEKRKESQITLQGLIEKEVSAGQLNGVNGHAGHDVPFVYDFAAPILRNDKFSQMSIAGRVLQRFHGRLLRIGPMVYAFDSNNKIWLNQKTYGDTTINKFVLACAEDMVHSEAFLDEFCGANRAKSKAGFETTVMQAKRNVFSDSFISGAVRRVLKCAPDFPERSVFEFDANPYLLHVGNGVLDMVSGTRYEVRAEDYLLRRTGINWNEHADASEWESFVKEVFSENDDPEGMYRFIQEVFGYTLSGSLAARVLFIHWGTGGNGKSKVLGALRAIMGDYAGMMGCTSLGKQKTAIQKEIERISVKIEGRRAIVLDDLETESQWNGAYVKMLTEDRLPMRRLYEEEIDVPNRAKFHIGCNRAPEPDSSTDTAILRRMVFINYNRTFTPDAQADARIGRIMSENAEGILRWAVEGFQRLHARQMRFECPSEVIYNAESYKQEHFSWERDVGKVCADLFTAGDPRNENDWREVGELTKCLNDALHHKGITAKVNANWIGRFLNQKSQVRRISVQGVRLRQYCVKVNNIKDLAQLLPDN